MNSILKIDAVIYHNLAATKNGASLKKKRTSLPLHKLENTDVLNVHTVKTLLHKFELEVHYTKSNACSASIKPVAQSNSVAYTYLSGDELNTR